MRKCQFCGKECKNMPIHERYCKSNPDRKSRNPEPTHQNETKTLIDISGLVTYLPDDLVAWFIDAEGNRIYKTPDYCGIYSSKGESIPVVLCLTTEGTLLPPFMMEGFIGMFSKFQTFEEQEKPAEKEEPDLEKLIDITTPPKEKEPITQPDKPINVPGEAITKEPVSTQEAPKEAKMGILSGIFSKKKPEPKPISKETTDLIKKIKDASTN